MKPLHVAAALAAMSCCAFAQSEDSGFSLKVESRLIESTVLVRGADGKPVTGLPQTAFHITEDGAPQTVKYFAAQRQLPLSIGLIIDASDSQEKFVKEHEKEIEGFLKEVMEPKDHAFALCFGNHLRLTHDWTNSAADIVDSVHAFNKGDRSGPELGPVYTDKTGRELGTALFDAIYYPITERMATERQHRRVLIILSDGEENSSERDQIDAIEAAQSADTLVYSLRTTEHKAKDMTARDTYGMRVLNHIAEATGGRSFDVAREKTKDIFASIAADLKSLYEIGYYSTNTRHDHGFRKVTVDVDGDGLQPQTRTGYVSR